MGRYLDQLHAEFDELTAGITAVVDRAADDNRDVTDDENERVERDRSRATELESAIKHYTDIEAQQARVSDLRGRVATMPAQRNAAPPGEPEYDVEREFPSIGDYAITVHRAMTLKDADAIAKLERATAHQMTTDNAGLIPRPILGPVINLLETGRPFINSITKRGLPTGKFDRPVITQHVAIGEQAVEKDLTASQKMLVGTLPVTAKTWAGHLNISRQDVKWSSPAILSLVFEDFAAIYADVTDNDACDSFVASITGAAVPIDEASAGGVTEALYAGSAAALSAKGALPDTMWVAPDVWAALGGMTNGVTGASSFPSLSLTGTGGNPLGLKLVVDANFAAGTMVVGPSRMAEWYEDVDGLLQVGEPDVLGQLVGYAGFGAFINVAPTAYTKYTMPAPVGGQASASSSGSK